MGKKFTVIGIKNKYARRATLVVAWLPSYALLLICAVMIAIIETSSEWFGITINCWREPNDRD